jgi:cytoskeletal protein RodZ
VISPPTRHVNLTLPSYCAGFLHEKFNIDNTNTLQRSVHRIIKYESVDVVLLAQRAATLNLLFLLVVISFTGMLYFAWMFNRKAAAPHAAAPTSAQDARGECQCLNGRAPPPRVHSTA